MLKYVPSATTRDMDDINVFLNRFTNLIHAMKTGVFIPANQSGGDAAPAGADILTSVRTQRNLNLYKSRRRCRRVNEEKRFWSKVDKHGPMATHQPISECWL